MSDSLHDQEKASHLRFQMWDKHLTELNNIWDLEAGEASVPEQEQPESSPSPFHTTLWNDHLLTLNQSWQISSAFELPPPTSFQGKLLLPFKKLVLRWVQPFIDAVVAQQNAVTAQIVQTCNGMVKAVNDEAIKRLDAQKTFNAKLIQALNSFVELVDMADSELESYIEQLRIMVWTFDRRKEALEIDEVLLNKKVEHILSLIKDRAQSLSQEEVEAKLPEQGRQDDYTYFLFEHRYRGDEATIKQRQEEYIRHFQGCTNVLDIGCGRGEFLELLRDHQITGYGIDINQMMVQYCRKKDLPVEEAEVVSHLQSLDDRSLDGIFIAQMVEHCSPQQLYQVLQLCFDKLQPQKYLVVETQNPTSLYAFSHFYRDMSHEKPVHPDALEYLLKTIGFQDTQIEYKAPFPEKQKLQELEPLDSEDGQNAGLRAKIETLNRNIRQLNEMLYGYLDYAVIARKTHMF